MEYYSPTERDKELIHATIWLNFENTMLTERRLMQKAIQYMIPFL